LMNLLEKLILSRLKKKFKKQMTDYTTTE
jgi:hypothetical protein